MKRLFLGSIALVLLIGLAWIGCGTDQGPVAPSSEIAMEPAAKLIGLARAMEVQNQNTDRLMAIAGVAGTATGLGPKGNPTVLVFTEKPGVGGIPQRLDGVPVIVKVTGKIVALPKGGKKPPREEIDPTGRFDRPVPIGVSTGHPDVTAGTIGARVKDGSNVYALSNNHVYANENNASIGDNVLQPGSYDGGAAPNDVIGTLDAFEPIEFDGSNNIIDAAIALSSTAFLGNATPSDGYGTPKIATVPAAINLSVMKYGRTTGLTKGRITAINAIVNVEYDQGIALFVNQIVISPGSFSAGGDSGSLVVVDGKGKSKADKGKPVGLLFAGSSLYTIANPIDPVLASFEVTIDGE